MNVEMEALEKNKTWELVRLPVGKKVVGCKWVYIVKYRADESIERHKLQLVSEGFVQTFGIDYQETFAVCTSCKSYIGYRIQAKPWRSHVVCQEFSPSGGHTTLVYDDDIVVMGNDNKEKQFLNQCVRAQPN